MFYCYLFRNIFKFYRFVFINIKFWDKINLCCFFDSINEFFLFIRIGSLRKNILRFIILNIV